MILQVVSESLTLLSISVVAVDGVRSNAFGAIKPVKRMAEAARAEGPSSSWTERGRWRSGSSGSSASLGPTRRKG